MSIAKKWIAWATGKREAPPISDTMEDYLLVREAEFFRRFPKGMVLDLDGVNLAITKHIEFRLSSSYILGRRSGIECVYVGCQRIIRTVKFDIDEVEALWPNNKENDNG